MKSHLLRDILLTIIAPVVWGSTYIVTTSFIPDGHPLAVAFLRLLPASLLLMLIVRQLPEKSMIPKILVLGLLNFTVFWWLLFEAAYRLPGGVAATLGATQVIIVLFLSRLFLNTTISVTSMFFSTMGVLGVGVLLYSPGIEFEPLGILAALCSALSMALGTVLTKHWKPSVSTLTFTAWQLAAGTLLIIPFVFLQDIPFPTMNFESVSAIAYLSLLGAGFTYALWFRGIDKLGPNMVAPLGLFSPISAVLLGWVILAEHFTMLQIFGFLTILLSIVFGQRFAPKSR